jgi:hypothetical protein
MVDDCEAGAIVVVLVVLLGTLLYSTLLCSACSGWWLVVVVVVMVYFPTLPLSHPLVGYNEDESPLIMCYSPPPAPSAPPSVPLYPSRPLPSHRHLYNKTTIF